MFLFKGCWWFPGSSRPSWSTWTSCKFHNMFSEHVSYSCCGCCHLFVFPSTGHNRAERFQRLKCESIFSRVATCHTLFYSFFYFLFLLFFRVHKVRKETLDWLDPLELRYVYQLSVQTSLNTTPLSHWSVLLCIYSAFQYLWKSLHNLTLFITLQE